MNNKHIQTSLLVGFIVFVVALFINHSNMITGLIVSILLGLVVAISYYRLALLILAIDKEMVAYKDSSIKDKLTGLYNRNYFDEAVEREFSSADRSSTDISIIYFDIDYFKKINDTYGHDIGDSILVAISKTVNEETRHSDVLCRWGGDEFVLLLPDTEIEDAKEVAEKIRASIEEEEFGNSIKTTISLGVAQRARYEYYSSLFRRVDKALYTAKEHGRNQVSVNEYYDEDIMIKFAWLDSWNFGHMAIDSQHKQLINHSNALSELYSKEQIITDEMKEISDSLFEDVRLHFKYEVAELRKVNYPHADEHDLIHTDLLEQLNLVKLQFENGDIDIKKYLYFVLNELVINHFLEEDLKFREYVS